jgi:hypothetical protein
MVKKSRNSIQTCIIVNKIADILDLDWNEHKTCRQSAMNFYPDFESYLLDFYFLMYLYIVVSQAGKQILCLIIIQVILIATTVSTIS